jgi:folate-binding protein YgfZ
MSILVPTTRVDHALELGPEDRLRVAGADARDLLHRISASEVRELDGERARHLLFVNDKGRLIDAPLAVRIDDAFRLYAGPGRGPDLRTWLEKWIIVDDVEIGNDDEPAWLLGEPDLGSGRVFVPETQAGPAVQLGGTPPAISAPETWDLACLQARRFFAGTVTTIQPNPLELGWKNLIAFDKGCYIGQEVIARMDTYDKVRRGLAIVSLHSTPTPGEPLSIDGKKCGEVLWSAALAESNVAWAVIDKTLLPGAALDPDATLIDFV